MNLLRSILFNILYIGGSLFWSIVLLPVLLFPPRIAIRLVSDIYSGSMRLAARYVMGLKLEIRGWENLPKDGHFIIAAKHQSAFETLVMPFMKELRYPAIVLKKELTRLPIWGQYHKRMGFIPIDRSAGKEALKEISDGCKKALADGRSVLIFPQGTRIKPGVVAPYKPGLAKIYKDVHVPIVPIALNTGVFWPKNAFIKKPGTIVFDILPPIPAGLPPLKMMEQLERVLEEASDRLVVAAGGPTLSR